MSTKFLSPGWRMPRNANQSKQSNYSMDFDGSSQYVEIAHNSYFDQSVYSFSFWINNNLNSGVSNDGIITADSSTRGWSILQDDQTLKFNPNISGGSGQIDITNFFNTTSTWIHCAITFDGTNLIVYKNGTSVGSSSSGTRNLNSNNNPLRIGNNTFASGRFFNGQINEVCIFDYALSPSQVTTLWGGGTSVSNPMALPSPPIAYYPLGTSAYNGEYLAENNAIGDYVFEFNVPSGGIDRITLNQGITLTGNKTFSAWINLTTAQNSGGFLFFGEASTNYYLFIQGDYIYIRDSSGLSSAQYTPGFSLNTWYHICISGNGTNLIPYVNGSPISGTYVDREMQSENTIGSFSNGTFPYRGEMSNIQIWDTNLSGPEVTTLYNYGSPIQTLANIPQNSNLKAWYKLDASEVYNSSTTEWSIDNNQNPSAYASSLDFVSSESDYIQIPYNVNLTPQNGNFTISAWINTDNLSGWHSIWCTQNLTSSTVPLVALHTFGNKVRATVGGSTNNPSYGGSWALLLDSTQSLITSTWYHIAVSYNMSGNAQIYINGSPDNSGPIENPQTSWDTGDRFIGEGEDYWSGKISNLSIWNTDLTSAQITEIYNNGTPSNLSSHSATSNLVSWWKLNNTTTGIQDSKGSNNGTNNGATEYPGFVNTLAGDSSGMTQANLVQSDLQTVAPYSKYAMNFDGTDYIDCGDSDDFSFGDGSTDSPFSVSAWVNMTDATKFRILNKAQGSSAGNPKEYLFSTGGDDKIIFYLYQDNISTTRIGKKYNGAALTSYEGQWIHLAGTYDGSSDVDGIKIYLNGIRVDDTDAVTGTYTAMQNTDQPFVIGRLSDYANGKISNASIWNAALTSAQVSELYNEGLPSNLNSHSAYSNLISWWQLGENSSYVGGATNPWTFADEKGTNNGLSPNLPEIALVNGVGTTANGVSSGMSEGNLVGDAPYSTANALSSGMSVVSRVTDIPPTTTDADTTAFISRVTTAGGSLSTIEEQAVDTLVTDLKSANIWSKMSAIYPLVGASAAACAQNLKSSSYTGTFAGGWTYASTGITGNGNNNSMDTGLLPSTELSLNNTHLSFYSRTNTPTVTGDADMGVSAGNYALIEIWQGNFYSLINQNVSSSYAAVTTSLGHFVGSRISSSEVKGFQNGSPILTSSISSNNLATANISLGAMGTSYPSAREYAFASIGEGLTDAEASDFYTAVQAFQTTLSRNV